MKKLLALLLLSPLAFAEDNEMILLEDYLAKFNESMGDSESLYLTYRCLGLYGIMYSLMEQGVDEDLRAAQNTILNGQMTLMTIGEFLYNKLTPDKERRAYTDNVKNSVNPIVENYRRETNKSWINNGFYFNNYILSDAGICNNWIDGFSNLNK